mgnify:CR=1 FL=1
MDVSSLIPLVLPSVPGALDMDIEAALVDSAREFCERSLLLRLLDTRTVSGPDPNVSYSLPADTEIDMVVQFVVDGRERHPAMVMDYSTPPACTIGWERVGSATLRLHGVPDGAFELKSVLALRPILDAVEFSDELAMFQGALAEGAKASLLLQGESRWFNPQLAAASRGLFESGLAGACSSVARRFSRGGLRTKTSFF